MNVITNIRLWMTMSRRVAAFSLYRRKGVPDDEAMQRVNDLYAPSSEQLRYEEKRIQKLQR